MRKQLGQRGLTLLEMVTTIAGLMIVLGLMVSLAAYVRRSSAEELTRKLLSQLDKQVAGGNPRLEAALKRIPAYVPPGRADNGAAEPLDSAQLNNRAFVRALLDGIGPEVLREWPASMYDQVTLRDAWGTPVVYMAAGAPNAGMERRSRSFVMSAGADRRFNTVLDNIYSYERVGEP